LPPIMIASLSEPKRAQEVPRLIKRGAHKMSPAKAGPKNVYEELPSRVRAPRPIPAVPMRLRCRHGVAP